MDWGDAPAWTAIVASGAAIWVSIKARGDGKRSADASEKSATAAEKSAADGRRSADAAVRGVEIAAASLALQQEAMMPQFELRIDRAGYGTYRLVNAGKAAARRIALYADDEDLVNWDDPLGESLEPGDARVFYTTMPAQEPSRLRFTVNGAEDLVYVQMPTTS